VSALAVEIRARGSQKPGAWWGMQLDFAISGCAPGLVRDPLVLRRWVVELVPLIGMTAYGEPRLVHFGEGVLAGWTVDQLITTSNITAHFNDETNSALITIFSCQEFDPDVAIRFTVATFAAADCEATIMHRYIPTVI
jgi:S-adenosylmethionine/arginine decarboxylase-like enzyme